MAREQMAKEEMEREQMKKAQMKTLTVDLIADVMCPWCTLSLYALEQAIGQLEDEIAITLRVQPFELNPDTPAGGLPVFEHQQQKYGFSRQQVLANFAKIAAHGSKLGFTFNMEKRTHYYNTFDAHRLLQLAAASGRQQTLLHGLVSAYFTDARDVSNHRVLADVARNAGLNDADTMAVLTSDRFAGEVRTRQEHYRQLGVQSVPTLIINDHYLVGGSQPAAGYERILRDIASRAQ